ncbi:nitrogenase cofactor biosynthesis protein NifB [Propionivibrio dicarboxylicus]|uniref:FeMo cofactor biosynthesis protein NifB n=1 Tax=Propionivibrio dicarboxylicus TaxID=83767 RepID=A0A1G7VF86_9RHOO|nr:nitrogenase cofactor biosynthesis protein NifB [Propionivibrio dicarboxylicus]SDG58241.1 nitrogen fixation protein NifB [Propionivibrio dicarboxylicus]
MEHPDIIIPVVPASGGCSASACGASARQMGGLPEAVRRKVEEHPCYSEQAHHYFARMHAAVAPACNIQCNYCNRKYDCANESRPGVVSEVLTPEQAVQRTLAVGAAIPQMSVLGIAGPGDPLANRERTFATFRLLAEKAPDIKLCVSTNGLALPECVDELSQHAIEHVTITINCVDPDIGAKIYPWIFWQHRRVRGRAAAEILIAQQQKGLEMLVARGILVKVNSVLIPGVNDGHLEEVSRIVKAKGAFLHNVMPLIAAPEHGTFYGLTGQRGPTAAELKAVQDACAGDMTMMRHCRQCRADAVGLLGEDRGAEFTLEKVAAMEIDHEAALARRLAFREQVRAELEAKRTQAATQVIALHRPPRKPLGRPVLMAVATKGNGIINEHFGYAREFLVYEASEAGVRLIGHRKTEKYCGGSETCGDGESRIDRIVRTLEGCEAVLCARIGIEPWSRLEAAGIRPDTEHAMEAIEAAVAAVWRAMLEKGELADAATERQRA